MSPEAVRERDDPTEIGRHSGRQMGRRFWACLAAIVIGALAVRVGYIAGAKHGPCPQYYGGYLLTEFHSECLGGAHFVNDQYWYSTTADRLAHGHFFNTGPPTNTPLADHPPLEVFVLAGTSFAFDHLPLSVLGDRPRTNFGTRLPSHVREQRYTMALIGCGVVLLIGLLGRRVGGDRVGLFAALIAAVYPNMWVNDGLLFPEPLARLLVLAALLVALRCRRHLSTPAMFFLGVLCGLAALTRSELLLLLPALAIPLVWKLRRIDLRRALVAVLAATIGTVVILGPWFVFNLTRFKEPVFIGTNDGLTLAGANCHFGYYGSTIGLWAGTGCSVPPADSANLDESQVSARDRAKAFSYMRAHASRVPLVMAARIGRTFGLYRPADMVGYEVNENRERWASWLGIVTFYPVFVGAIAGAVLLYRRRARLVLWILCVPVVTTVIVVALTNGQVRYRAVAEPTLVVLAAVAIGAFVERRRMAAGAPSQ